MRRRLPCFALLLAAALAAEAQELAPGELPVRSRLELVGRERMPTLSEIREIIERDPGTPLLVCRMAVASTNIYAPRWCPTGDDLPLGYQQTDVEKEQSKVILQSRFGVDGRPLIRDDYSYEMMLLWGVGAAIEGRPAYAVISNVTGAAQVHVGVVGGEEPYRVTSSEATKRHPSLAVRGEGSGRQLEVVFDAGKDLVVQRARGFAEELVIDEASQTLGNGTQPRFSPDGVKLAYIREIYGEGEDRGRVERQEVVILTYELSAPVIVASGEPGEVLRAPTWSPDGGWLAWYKRREGVDPIWDLYACDVRSQLNEPRQVAENVVIEAAFEHVGPAWSPSSGALLYFSQDAREEEFYPVQRQLPSGEALSPLLYPKRINVANDLHARAWAEGDLILFTGIDRGPRELFVAVVVAEARK